MIIVYEPHAKYRITKRKIDFILINETINFPDSIKKLGNKYINTKKIDNNTLVDLDEEGNVIGIEILFVKERLPEFLERVQNEKYA